MREAMRSGAQDYVLKDELCPEMLLPVVEGFRGRQASRARSCVRSRAHSRGLGALVGSSRAIDECDASFGESPTRTRPCSSAARPARARSSSRARSTRRAAGATSPFVAVNCSALPGTLIESLIFGHERGAFTGAERRTRGQLELAGTGTILLDEIAEMPIELQAKLLRVLEDRRFRPLGAEQERPLHARVLASTHVDLERRIGEGRFRDDLYYRLNVVSIHVPALAEREEDIPELVSSFAAELPRRLCFSDGALTWLKHRPWPGNVRELRNVIERIALLAESEIVDVAMLDELACARHSGHSGAELDRMARTLLALPPRLGSKLDVIEHAVIKHAIESCGGNKSAAARLVGLDRKALDRRWERLRADETSASRVKRG